MIEASLADRDNIRIANEALAKMKSLGATWLTGRFPRRHRRDHDRL
jgi:hypothetical protein